MDWDDVRYFLALSRERTVKGAAKSLGVDTSTVTRRIAHLEEKVGRLFERSGASYALSRRGEMMQSSAEKIAEEMSLLSSRLRDDAFEKRTVRVSFPTLLSSLVLDVVRGLPEEHPELTLALEASDDKVDLKTAKVDVVVRIEENPAEELRGRRVGTLQVGVFASPEYARSHSFELSDARHAWIAWHESYSGKAPMRYLATQFPNARVMSEGKSGEAVFQAVRAGLGVGALPCLVAEQASLVELFRLPPEASPSVWVLSSSETEETDESRIVRQRLFRLAETLRSSATPTAPHDAPGEFVALDDSTQKRNHESHR